MNRFRMVLLSSDEGVGITKMKEHFDKLLLTLMFASMVGCVIYLTYTHQPPEVVTWAKDLAIGFQGALLGLITGVAIGTKITGDRNTIEAPKKPVVIEGSDTITPSKNGPDYLKG